MVREKKLKLNKVLLAFLFFLYASFIFTAPYDGEEFELLQPDGTYVKVLVYGDEYYQRVESLDGYTLIRDKNTNWICYAELSSEGELISTGIPYRMNANNNSGLKAQSYTVPPVEKGLKEANQIIFNKIQKIRAQIGDAPTLPVQSSSGGDVAALAAPASVNRTGTYIGLTLLIDFPDVRATIPQSEINNFCNQTGYTGYSNYGSVRDYFKAASNNKLDYQNYVADYYTAKYNKSYYTDPSIPYGQRARELIKEALQALDAKGFNFATLSTSGGYIIAINAFYAGNADNAWSQGLWPHASSMNGQFCADGVCSGRYQITNIGTSLSIRTFCHENGHMLLQWPDLYDYGYESNGAGNFCIMAFGANSKRPCLPNPYFRELSGWEDVTIINSSTNQTFTREANKIASLKYVNPSNSQERFYIEPRFKSGWNYYYPDSGLVIWHVDGNGSNNNEQMTCSQHYMVSVEQADGKYDLEKAVNYGDSNDLFDANNSAGFNSNTTPNSNWWCSGVSGLSVSNISSAGSIMSFTIGNSQPTPTFTFTAEPTPVGSGTGLCGTYFNNISLSGEPCGYRVDSEINFNWGSGSPSVNNCGSQSDNFSIRWQGEVQAVYSGTYTFYTITDDGVRLYIKNPSTNLEYLIIDKWIDQSATEWAGVVPFNFVKGEKYPIRLEYYEKGGDSSVKLLWSAPGISKEIVPKIRLYPSNCMPTNTVTSTKTNTPVPPTNTHTYTSIITETPTQIINTPTSTNTPTRTNTPVPPTHTFTRTNTPVPPTNTPTTVPTSLTSKLNLQVRNLDTDPCSSSNFRAEFKIINNTTSNINLSTLKVRMWFNNAEPVAFVNNDWVRVFNSSGGYVGYTTAIKDADGTMSLCTYSADRKANQYRTFSFASFNIPAGGYAVFPVWFWRGGYSPFDVNCDDFSKLGNTTTFSENKYFVLYENGKIVTEYLNSTQIDTNTGIEPCAISPDIEAGCITPQPTKTPVIEPTKAVEDVKQSISELISYPNPANINNIEAIKIKFKLGQKTEKIVLKVFTVSNKFVLKQEYGCCFTYGENEIDLPAIVLKNLSNGLYLYQLSVKDNENKIVKSEIGKLLILR